MKPYGRVLFNMLRFGVRRIGVKELSFANPLLLGWNTRIVFHKDSKVVLKSHINSDGRVSIIVDKNGYLEIGQGVYFNEGVMISSKSSVVIGDHCMFGPNVKLFDNNHVFDKDNGVSNMHHSKPIRIGKNCWIASNAVVTSGTTIGNNCVVGANCVVSGEIPDGMIVKQGNVNIIEPIK